MIDKVKTFLTILLILMLVFGLGYAIVNSIINLFKSENLITKDNINNYIKEEKLVTGYDAFYYINDCFENFVEACKQERYDDLYDIYIKSYLKNTNKEEVEKKLKSLKFNVQDMNDSVEYELEKIYSVDEDIYILNIKLNKEDLFLIVQTMNGKTYDYMFALVN